MSGRTVRIAGRSLPANRGRKRRTVYRDHKTLERFFVITEEFLSKHVQIALDMEGRPRRSNWPRRVFTTFKWQVKEVLRGQRKEIPESMYREIAAVLSGEMEDPGGMRILVDSETMRKFIDLYRRLGGEHLSASVPGLGLSDRDAGNAGAAIGGAPR